MLRIDKDLPIPPPGRGGGRPHKYPFDQMEPGDSFFVEVSNGRIEATQNNVLATARKRGYNIVTRQQGDGVRVWLLGEIEKED